VTGLLRRILPTGLGSLAGPACAACCAIPLLLAAGVLGGTGWAAGRYLRSVGLAAGAGLAWWWTRRRRIHTSGCTGGECACPSS
jgi:mercuric ion transport protein